MQLRDGHGYDNWQTQGRDEPGANMTGICHSVLVLPVGGSDCGKDEWQTGSH